MYKKTLTVLPWILLLICISSHVMTADFLHSALLYSWYYVFPLLVGAGLLYYLYHQFKVRSLFKSESHFRLHHTVSRFWHNKVSRYMTKFVITISEHKSISEALTQMVKHNVNSVVVVSGSIPTGIVTETDVLRILNENGFDDSVPVHRVVRSHFITASIDATLETCALKLLEHNIRKLPIVKDHKLVGIITMSDILRVCDDFLSTHFVNTENMPILKGIMQKKVARTTRDAKISALLHYWLRYDLSYCIVYSKSADLSKSIVKAKPLGIITTRDLIMQLSNDLNIEGMTVGQVMSAPLFSLIPGTEIGEANKIMLKKNFRRIPLTVGDQITGIVYQNDLLKAVYLFLNETLKKALKAQSQKDEAAQ